MSSVYARQQPGAAVMYRWIGPSMAGTRPPHPTQSMVAAGGGSGDESGSATCVRIPCRLSLRGEGRKALLRLGAGALPGDDPGRVPFRRPVTEPANLADDGLGCANRRRAGREDIRERRLDRAVERLT